MSSKCKCKFGGSKCNSNQKLNNYKCWWDCKTSIIHVCDKIYIRNSSTCSCNNDKHLGSINDDSVVICDEIIDTAKTVPTKRVATKRTSIKAALKCFYIKLAFLLISIALTIAVSIYC